MVSQKKKQTVKAVTKQLEEYPVVGILNMHKLPGRQLHEIRNKLRGKVVIRMVKKALIVRALKARGLEALEQYIQGEPALFLSREDPFKIARVLAQSTSEAPAKEGDIAPRDIVVKEGPTNLTPGPVIGELQKVKIPAGVEGEKIVVKKDTIVAKEGDVIVKDVADILSKLGVTPMEIGLNLIAVLEGGVVYGKSVLFVPEGYYETALRSAVEEAFNLSIYINYVTKENRTVLLSKAHREAVVLAKKAGIITSHTIGSVLAQAHAEGKAVEEKTKKD